MDEIGTSQKIRSLTSHGGRGTWTNSSPSFTSSPAVSLLKPAYTNAVASDLRVELGDEVPGTPLDDTFCNESSEWAYF